MDECKDPKHPEHICSLSARGEIDLIHSLAMHPTHHCNKCGAKANDQERLCEPAELPDIAWMGDGADVKLD